MPQPNFDPVRPATSRRYQRRGMSGSPSNWRVAPLTLSVIIFPPEWLPGYARWREVGKRVHRRDAETLRKQRQSQDRRALRRPRRREVLGSQRRGISLSPGSQEANLARDEHSRSEE